MTYIPLVGGDSGTAPGRRWTMRTHLLGMAAAVMAVTALAGLALTAGTYSSARRRAVSAARDSARQVAGALDRDLGQAVDLTAASAPGIVPILDQATAVAAHPEYCSLSFSGIGVFPPDGAVHILTADGRVLCSSAAGAPGRSYAGTAWFPRLATGGPVVVGEDHDAVAGRPVALIAVPVRTAAGALHGILVDTLTAGPLARALADTFGGPAHRQYVVVDAGGGVLSSSVDPAEEGRRFPRIADGATARDSRGTSRIWGAGAVSRTGWQVWAATTESAALGPARQERRRLGLVVAATLAAAVGLALLVNRRLLRPVRGLATTVARAETEPAARAAEAGPAELADLAGALNRMLATRQRNEQLIAELAEELQATAVSLVEAREQERQALAVALHDTTLQGLIATLWQVDTLSERGGAGPAELDRLHRDLETLVNQTRTVTVELRPPALQEAGLGGAVDELARRTGDDSNLAVDVEDRLAGARFAVAVEMLVYRMVQEALQNVRKHARASSVQIVLEEAEGRLRATVSDDGVGIDETVMSERARQGHFGVVSMRDTARLAKGRFSIGPGDAGGTVVEMEIPVG